MSEPFDPKKVVPGTSVHLNGGSAFNYWSGTLVYEGREIGSYARGRRNKNERFSEITVEGEVFSMPADQPKAVEAIKNKLVALEVICPA